MKEPFGGSKLQQVMANDTPVDGARTSGPESANYMADEHIKEMAQAYQLAQSGARLRLITIAAVILSYFAFPDKAIGSTSLAALVIVLSIAHGLTIGILRPYGRFPTLIVTRTITMTECVLITLLLAATGGLRSPLYLIWYVAIVAVATRFDHWATIKFSGVFVLAYALMALALGQLPELAGTLVLRSMFIVLVGATAAELSRVAFKAATARFQSEFDAESLRKLNDLKSHFIATASHEIRTPLTAIRGFSELLADDPTIDADVRQEFARTINLESERLARLADSLLDLHRIESGALMLHAGPLDLNVIIEQLCAQQQPVAAAKGLALVANVAGDLPAVSADADAIHQVLLNLVANAIKFTATGQIKISAEKVGDRVLVSVTDTGRGILPNEQERIFEPFYQAHAVPNEKPAGAGLGLAICQQLLALHKSDLVVRSRPGEGSTFAFELKTLAA